MKEMPEFFKAWLEALPPDQNAMMWDYVDNRDVEVYEDMQSVLAAANLKACADTDLGDIVCPV